MIGSEQQQGGLVSSLGPFVARDDARHGGSAATPTSPAAAGSDRELSPLSAVVVHILKGPLYRDSHERHWSDLLRLRTAVADYVAVLGLVLMVDEAEGYAYLRSRPGDPDEPELPRLIGRRALSFPVSVLLALLRKRLAEFDASSSDVRLVMSREQVVEMLRLFLPDAKNEARLVDTIDTHINKVVEMGFLRRLQGDENRFEVRRILKAYVDGQWLSELDARLTEYRTQLTRNGSNSSAFGADSRSDAIPARFDGRRPEQPGREDRS